MTKPIDIFESMSDIQYGWMDSAYQDRSGESDESWYENYALLLPEEVEKLRIGTCYEQALYANYLFDQYTSLPHFVVYIRKIGSNTHTFLVYQEDNSWYWFETADQKNKGIHGPYKSLEDIVADAASNMEPPPGGDRGYSWSILDPKNFTSKLRGNEFMDLAEQNMTMETFKDLASLAIGHLKHDNIFQAKEVVGTIINQLLK
jgi:hypothetical protein